MEAMREAWTDGRLDDLIQIGGGLVAGLVGVMATIISLAITQI